MKNREALLKEISEMKQIADDAKASGDSDTFIKASKVVLDARVKLNDKFNIEEEEGQKRIIVVPQKHDIICKWTSRECSAMPSKEACMKYYNLIDAGKNDTGRGKKTYLLRNVNALLQKKPVFQRK